MIEQIRDWFALRGRRKHGGAYPTAPPGPKLTPEEEAEAQKQLYGEEHAPPHGRREDS